jgi:hypothetical protein
MAKSSDDKNYDVAISFLARDEPTAKAVYDPLADGLKVFFFPRNQDELIGTDGLESMREPFFDSKVVVILFREPWGKTPWTRVEETAIKECCLNEGWDGLVFVQLDKNSTLPKWLPQTHVRFVIDDYGIEGLIGAIKARVQRRGGRIVPLDAMAVAKRVRRESEYLADRQRLTHDQRWITEIVQGSVRETADELVRLAKDLNASQGFDIKAGAQGMKCVLRSDYVSLLVNWKQSYANLVVDEPERKEHCYLLAAEFSGGISLPGEGIGWAFNPIHLAEHKFKVDVSETRELVWKEEGRAGRIAPQLLADRIMQIFLDLVSRADQGKVEKPNF